jgi:hypothetical protein
VVLAAVRVRGEALEAILEPPHRPAELHREPAEAHFLREQDALVAEAAPDVGGDHPDTPLIDAEALREAGAVDVRHLRRGVHDELIEPAVAVRDDAAALDRRHVLARGADAPLHLDRGTRADAREIVLDHRLEHDVVRPLVVHARRARRNRLHHVDDRGQRFVIHLDQRRDVLGFRAGRRDAHRDRLADLAHLAPGEDVLRRRAEALERRVGDDRLHAGEVVDGEDRGFVAGGSPHRADARVRDRRAHERDLQHAGEAQVGDVLAAAAEEAPVLLAAETSADALTGRLVHTAPLLRVPTASYVARYPAPRYEACTDGSSRSAALSPASATAPFSRMYA